MRNVLYANRMATIEKCNRLQCVHGCVWVCMCAPKYFPIFLLASNDRVSALSVAWRLHCNWIFNRSFRSVKCVVRWFLLRCTHTQKWRNDSVVRLQVNSASKAQNWNRTSNDELVCTCALATENCQQFSTYMTMNSRHVNVHSLFALQRQIFTNKLVTFQFRKQFDFQKAKKKVDEKFQMQTNNGRDQSEFASNYPRI